MNLFVELEGADFFVFVIIYIAFLLDNVLLTVVVPIIPDFLFSNELNVTSTNDQHFGPASLSPLQRKYEALENDNGPLGALLASKAFVQLAFTPLIGYLIGVMGCYVPLLIGSCNMLIASIIFAYGNSYGLLVLARGLHGSSSAAIAVSGMCILAKNLPCKLRPKLMPMAFGGIGLGVLIGYPLGGAAYQALGKVAPFLFISFFVSVNIALQLVFLKDDVHVPLPPSMRSCYNDCLVLLKDKQIIIATIAICVCTSSMAILEPCVPIWLLARMSPPPTRWQLGSVFIPDSIGYFIGCHFSGLLPIQPWRISLVALVVTGLSCCALPLSNSISELGWPHFGVGIGVGTLDASLVPLLATFVDTKGIHQYGPIYTLQQASVSMAYSFGPLIGGQVVHILSFPWLIRIVGFLNIIVCPLLLELENKQGTIISPEDNNIRSYSTMVNNMK